MKRASSAGGGELRVSVLPFVVLPFVVLLFMFTSWGCLPLGGIFRQVECRGVFSLRGIFWSVIDLGGYFGLMSHK